VSLSGRVSLFLGILLLLGTSVEGNAPKLSRSLVTRFRAAKSVFVDVSVYPQSDDKDNYGAGPQAGTIRMLTRIFSDAGLAVNPTEQADDDMVLKANLGFTPIGAYYNQNAAARSGVYSQSGSVWSMAIVARARSNKGPTLRFQVSCMSGTAPPKEAAFGTWGRFQYYAPDWNCFERQVEVYFQ